MLTQAQFLDSVRQHRMEIEIDSGAHRSILFRLPPPHSWHMHFRLTTFPGHLCISGDMGTFVFARLHDMFDFFRDPSGENRVNLSYWAEKLQATSKPEGHTAFCEDTFRRRVLAAVEDWCLDRDAHAKAVAALEDEWDGLIGRDRMPQTAEVAIQGAMDWRCPITGNRFSDPWGWRVTDYTHHFRWCCHAIVWGIKRYDLHKAGRDQAAHDALVLSGAA